MFPSCESYMCQFPPQMQHCTSNPFLFSIFEKKIARTAACFCFFILSFLQSEKLHKVLWCLWINSVALLVSSLVWVTQLRSYLELN